MLMDLNLEMILILGLASFRLTRLIVFDKITNFLREPFFDEIVEEDENGEKEVFLVPKTVGMKKWIGELLSCYWCIGIWVSAGLLSLYLFLPKIGCLIILLLAIAAIGSIIETFISNYMGN